MSKGSSVECSVCRRVLKGYIPKGGDGSVSFVHRHNTWIYGMRQTCPGSNRAEAATQAAKDAVKEIETAMAETKAELSKTATAKSERHMGAGEFLGNVAFGLFCSALALAGGPALAFFFAVCLFGLWALLGLFARAIQTWTCAPGSIWCWTSVEAYIAAVLMIGTFGFVCWGLPSLWKGLFEPPKDEKGTDKPDA